MTRLFLDRLTPGCAAPAILAMTAALGLSGCGGAPPPPPPTIINASLTASADVNAGSGGAGAPVKVRIYQLASPAAFKGATFFPVFEKDAATLKDDLVKRDEYLMAPGSARSLVLTPEDKVQSIGVFAAYRDFENVAWQATYDVVPHKTSAVAITIGRAGVELVPAKPTAEKPAAK